MGLGIQIQVGIAKMYFTHYKDMLHSKSYLLFTFIQFIIIGCGLGQSQAEPSRSQQLRPGSGFVRRRPPKAKPKPPKPGQAGPCTTLRPVDQSYPQHCLTSHSQLGKTVCKYRHIGNSRKDGQIHPQNARHIRGLGPDIDSYDLDEIDGLLYDTNLKEEVETGGNGGNGTQEGRESKGLWSIGADIETKTMTIIQ